MMKKKHWRFLLSGLLLLGAQSVVALEARVRSRNGVPRIEMDGKPQRARIFFGNSRNRSVTIGTNPRLFSFEFMAAEDSQGRGTFHFRFGKKPGFCRIDDFHLEEIETGRAVFGPLGFENGQEDFTRNWRSWPSKKESQVGTETVVSGRGGKFLEVRLTAPEKGKWPDYHIYTRPKLQLTGGKRYRVSFRAWADHEREWYLGCYRPGSPFIPLMHLPGVFEEQIGLAADVGVNMVSFSMNLPWPPPGKEASFKGAEVICRKVLAANPKAQLLPRIGMEPPTWWKRAHPEHCMSWEDGRRRRGVVVSSELYRREAGERLRQLIRFLEKTFPDSIVGYHPAGQNTGEWFYQDTWKSQFSGYSPIALHAWRAWLRNRYREDAALQAAWNQPEITLATAPVPSAVRRHAASHGVFREAPDERDIIDFSLFEQEAMADCVCSLAKIIREETGGRKLSVFFFGYVFEFAPVHRGPSASGHYGLRRVLSSPDIDILCSPISYFDRGLGQSAPSMTATESIALAGKLWLNEDDTATFLSSGDFPGHAEKVDNLSDTNSMLLRNVGQAACRNLATWWMDLGATGWFNDKRMWDEMENLKPMDMALLDPPHPFRPEVALVNHARSMNQVATGGSLVTRPLVYEGRGALARMGAPFGQYLLDDVLNGRVDAKLYVFLNAWALTAGERRQLRQRLRGKTVIWCYAPGYHDLDRPSLEGMKELTGHTLVPFAKPALPKALVTESGRRAGLTTELLGSNKPLYPLFHATRTSAEKTLACYPTGEAAVAWIGDNQGTSIFCGVPRLTTDLLRFAAKRAGVHLYTGGECVFYANEPFFVLHGTGPANVTLSLKSELVLEDLLSSRKLGRAKRFDLPLGFGKTRILRVR